MKRKHKKGKERDEKTVKEIHESNKRYSDGYICSAHRKYFLTQSTLLLKGAQAESLSFDLGIASQNAEVIGKRKNVHVLDELKHIFNYLAWFTSVYDNKMQRRYFINHTLKY